MSTAQLNKAKRINAMAELLVKLNTKPVVVVEKAVAK